MEHFIGVAQVPIGVAGPLLVDGEHAQGEFYVPLATAEGTLVASYNRGMKLLREAGGVTTTILDDRMQRAPAFLFERPRGAGRSATGWRATSTRSRGRAETTTNVGQADRDRAVLGSRMLYTRFDYTTGDAAGQNLTGKATAAACAWIVANYDPGIERFFLESNFATDKKSSQVNMLHTRGKRVVAEATIPDALFERRDALEQRGHVPRAPGLQPRRLHVRRQQQRRPLGQRHHRDVHRHRPGRRQRRGVLAAFVYAELRENGDYYYSITMPSLIVATYGGGTGLATQRECLELLGCYGTGKVRKLAEIVAATVLCGELSLGSAIVAEEWVKAHDLWGATAPRRGTSGRTSRIVRSVRAW